MCSLTFPAGRARRAFRNTTCDLDRNRHIRSAKFATPPTDVPRARLSPGRLRSPRAARRGRQGEVYRGHDTRLNRDVALKILPDAFAADPERLARFQREAQVLASLNHPNIAHIHGLEESGGVRALVMELVEGEDLAATDSARRDPARRGICRSRNISLRLWTPRTRPASSQ